MIYVKRDSNLISPKVLQDAARAQAKLEALPENERAAFIKKKSRIWRAFSRYLSKMSYGKCWYSESPDPQSIFDVDHYRPKLSARRADDHVDPGYEWLAFSWDNYRFAAQRSNRRVENEETGHGEGKGDWFPLLDGSPKACWENRCENEERPVLLDPTIPSDVRLINVLDDGRMGPSQTCLGTAIHRVEQSIELYGLNLPRLKEARLRLIREVNDLCDMLAQTLEAGGKHAKVADELPIDKHVETIRTKTLPSSPYSKAARAQLMRLGYADLCVQPEEMA